MKTFRHSGKAGDIIFSLPTIRELGGGILYIPENTGECTGLYSNMKDLLLLQPYIHEVREYPSGLAYKEQAPGIPIDFDLDLARNQPMKGVIHIVKRYMDAFGVNYPGWKEPWLQLDALFDRRIWGVEDNYTLINYTGRHITNEQLNITSRVYWGHVVEGIEGPKYFVGTTEEHANFCSKYNVTLPHLQTDNILQLALLIQKAKAVYCNQSCVLALSQSLGKEYYLDVKPQKMNTLLYTQNENILQ